MLKTLQGYDFSLEVKDPSSRLIIFDGLNKYTVEDPVASGEAYVLTASANTTKEWIPGRYSYQLLDASGIADKGVFKVEANLEYATELGGFWQKALQQVEARLAGKTIDPAVSVSVGDKHINYMNTDELLKLRNFILQKIAEEEEEEGDEEAITKNDQHVIKYRV